jgi:hypothetical protein
MSAARIEFPTASLPLQPESNRHRIVRDLTAAIVTFELVAECEELGADRRRLVEAARLRLLSAAEQLMSSEAGNPSFR